MEDRIEYDILLMKYMDRVIRIEGGSFAHEFLSGGRGHPDLKLTEKEMDELGLIEKEIEDYYSAQKEADDSITSDFG